MQRSVRDIIIGATTIAVFGLLTVWLSARNADGAQSDSVYHLTAQFGQVDGLLTGDDVRVSGVSVGKIESERLDGRFRAVLTLAIQSGVTLPSDTSAAIHTNGLFGSKYIELEPGGDLDNLADGDSILFTQDSLVISDLLDLIISEGKARQAADAKAKGAAVN